MAPRTNPSTDVLESAVDWLTVSSELPRARELWPLRALALLDRERRAGNRLVPFRLNQYQGQACGRARVAWSGDRILVQLSGAFADTYWRTFWRERSFVSRLDIAVTVRYPEPNPGVAASAYADACAYRDAHPRAALPTLIQNAEGGATLYVGRRSSGRLMRVYNKEAECVAQGDDDGAERYRNAWRFELETHDNDALALGLTLDDSPDAGSTIRFVVAHFLEQHGVPVPFRVEQAAVLPTGFARRSDADTRIRWLQRTVRPAIDWLKSTCTAAELRTILNLNDEPAAEGDLGADEMRCDR